METMLGVRFIQKVEVIMFAFIGNIGPWELMIILLIALIVVGPGKLPEVAKGLGKAFHDFKKATAGVQQEFQEAVRFDDPPAVTQKPALEMPEYQKEQNEREAAQLEAVAQEEKENKNIG